MSVVTEGKHRGESRVSEANGKRSRDTVVCAAGGIYAATSIMGMVTASNEWKPIDFAATDGSEKAAGILLAEVDATAGPADGVCFVRDCEHNPGEVDWPTGATQGQIDGATAELKALGIMLTTGETV